MPPKSTLPAKKNRRYKAKKFPKPSPRTDEEGEKSPKEPSARTRTRVPPRPRSTQKNPENWADDQGWGDKSPGGESIAFLNRDFSFLSLGSTRLGITASEPSEPFHQPCATSLKQI